MRWALLMVGSELASDANAGCGLVDSGTDEGDDDNVKGEGAGDKVGAGQPSPVSFASTG